MDARQLRYFLAVVDHGGFVRAAASLRIAQPSLSQAIATFEREIGVTLFHRVGRGVVLSTAGSDLVGPARAVLRELDHAEASVTGARTVGGGHLDIVSAPSPGVEPLTRLVTTFMARHPAVRINVAIDFTADAIIAAIRTGAHEIGLLGTAEPIHLPDLLCVPAETQPFVLVSPPGDGGPLPDEVHWDELGGARLIASSHGSLMRAVVDRIIASGVDATIVAEVAIRSSILPLVLAGAGQAVLTSAWAPQARQMGVTVQRLLPETHLYVTAVSRRSGLTPAASSFLQVVADQRE